MIGKTISHYTIIEKLGEGGMGVVYKAEDLQLGRMVALKFLSPNFLKTRPERNRFEREAKAAAALSHPQICTIYEIGQSDEGAFIAMEYLEGRNLNDMVSEGPLKTGEAADIAIQILRGLQDAHEKGIIHRDIKSANIMISPRGRAKIMDFGLATVEGQTRLTVEGTTVGTVESMSPEQAGNEEIDHRSDIWSVGVVLYEMLTGRLPFGGGYPQAVLYSVLNDEPEPVTGLRTGVPVEIDQIIGKALSKNRDERYQHADDMLVDLKRFVKKLESPEKVARSDKKKRFPVFIVAVILIGSYFILKPWIFQDESIFDPIPVAVISFENQTNDPQFDYLQAVIPNLLITSLEQSKYISVATWERLRDLQKQAGKPDSEYIDKELGYELCGLEGISTIVLGTFTKAGEIFVTDIKILDVDTKQLITSASSKGRGAESILEKQIDELSREVSRGIGMSERLVRETESSITAITSTSLEAYNYFIEGTQEYRNANYNNAVGYFEKAIDIDSTLASAYHYMGRAYGQLGLVNRSMEASEKAKTLSGGSTEKDRLFIDAYYAMAVENDLDKQLAILEKIVEKYPKEKSAYFELGNYYQDVTLEKDKAINAYKGALALDPDFGQVYNVLAYISAVFDNDIEQALRYIDIYESFFPGDLNPLDSRGEVLAICGRIDEAISAYEKVFEKDPDFINAGIKISYLYAQKEDYEKAIEWTEKSIQFTSSEAWRAASFIQRALFRYVRGDEQRCMQEIQGAASLAEQAGNNFWLASIKGWLGFISFGLGDFEESRVSFDSWYELSKAVKLINPFVPGENECRFVHSFMMGLIALEEGRIEDAREVKIGLEPAIDLIRPNMKAVMSIYYDQLSAKILMAEGEYQKAAEILEETAPRNIPKFEAAFLFLYSIPFLKDDLAVCYERSGDTDRSIEEYIKLVDSPQTRKLSPLIHPLYHYRLAKLYEKADRISEATDQYEKFLEIKQAVFRQQSS